MPLEHHPLTREFPQQGDVMRKLMQSHPHFPRLAGEYEALDKRIYEIEDGIFKKIADEARINWLQSKNPNNNFEVLPKVITLEPHEKFGGYEI